MPDLGLVGVVLLLLVIVGVMAPRALAAEPPPKPAAAQTAPAQPAQQPAPVLTAKELEERLAKLAAAQDPPPPKPHPVAMCYKTAGPPQTADYVCPVDGSRTHYVRASRMVDLVEQIPYLRQQAKELRGLDVSIDEKEMCRKCSPNGHGGIALVVRHPDGRVVRTENPTGVDLQILREFLAGGIVHGDDEDGTPLKKQLPRLRQLLGLPEK